MVDAASHPGQEPEQEYILGTDSEETRRLREQHEAWAERLRALCKRAGLLPGDKVFDLGCGPGFTTFELAQLVGPHGHVTGQDVSARFLEDLERGRSRQNWSHVSTALGPAESLDVPPGSLQLVYTRWLLCWLEKPGEVVSQVKQALAPGGAFVIQEYLDWGAMKLVPRSAAFDRAVEVCMAAWPAGGSNIDVGDELPGLAQANGFRVEHFEPTARLGRVASPEWRWVTGFLRSWLPKLVERGLCSVGDCEAALLELDARELDRTGPPTFVLTPVVVEVILRKDCA